VYRYNVTSIIKDHNIITRPSDPTETNFKLSMWFPRDIHLRDGTENYTVELGYIYMLYIYGCTRGENLNIILL